MEPHLPPEVMYRPKMGFAVPLGRWFRGPLKQRVREGVMGSTLADAEIFDMRVLQNLVDAHQSGARDYSSPLWTVLMFESFLRNVIAGDERRPIREAG
jgi:asparagine synthase (glutamine-hydrolysing)